MRGTRHAAGTATAVTVQVGRAETMGGEGTREQAGVDAWMGQTGANGCEGWRRHKWERSLCGCLLASLPDHDAALMLRFLVEGGGSS